MSDHKINYENGKVGHEDMTLGGNLSIKVDCYGGSHVYKAIQDMAVLANRLGIDVWASLNGVQTLCRPGDDPQATIAAWDRAIVRGGSANFPQYASA